MQPPVVPSQLGGRYKNEVKHQNTRGCACLKVDSLPTNERCKLYHLFLYCMRSSIYVRVQMLACVVVRTYTCTHACEHNRVFDSNYPNNQP
jgi:hypothetical protein